MRDTLFVHLPGSEAGTVAWVSCGDGGLGEVARGEVTAADGAGRRVVVLVPGEEVVLTRVWLPTRSWSRMAEAAPYALEEHFASDVDDLHFALGDRLSDNTVAVAVVARSSMDSWLTRLREAGLEPDAVVPDTLAVPRPDQGWGLLLHDGRALLRNGAQQGLAGEADYADFLVRRALEDCPEGERPVRLQVTTDATEPPLDEYPVEVELDTLDEPVVARMARHYQDTAVINLLQGAYSRAEQVGRLWRPWRAAAALLTVWLGLQLGITATDYFRLSQAEAELRQEIRQVYLDAFPDARRVVNPRVQMERKLAELRGGDDDGGFLGMLSGVSESLADTQGLALERISYKNGQLDIALTIGDLQRLESLKQTLADQQWEVSIQSAQAQGNQVKARLQVRRRS